jgi:hypothetical protein
LKYGIRRQLPAASADLAQRFHAALLQRMYQVQQGATPALEDPLDAAIAAMHRWAAGEPTGVRGLLEQLRDQCAQLAEGYSYGYAGGRAIRTIGVEPLLRAGVRPLNACAAAPQCPCYDKQGARISPCFFGADGREGAR